MQSINLDHIITAVSVFADGADLNSIRKLAEDPVIRGFTTNPTLMKQAGVTDYLSFARKAIEITGERPISLEVFSDDLDEMIRQGIKLSTLGTSVNVKIPVTNTESVSTHRVIKALVSEGVSVNVTAIFTESQIETALDALTGGPASFVSVFAGRIADSGIDPVPVMARAVEMIRGSSARLIWASPREVLNVVQAAQVGCDVITVTPDLISKLKSIGKPLEQFSLETVQMFARDAAAAGYAI